MEAADSRKRPLDSDTESAATKRSNPGSDMKVDQDGASMVPNVDNVSLKILVPSIAAGAIIGKGGETITEIQKETKSTVKMSKNNDFYPGTSERVCLVSGTVESVRKVLNFIMDRIREKPDPNPKPCDGELKANYERHKQMKILVPNSTAGMVIGKGGAFIRQIKDDSGAYIQVSQKSKDMSLPERCVTIAGDLEQNREAMELVLEKIVEDPQSSSCPNISYADVKGPVASSNPTGSPFASSSARSEFAAHNSGSNVFGNIGNSMNNLNLNANSGGGGAANHPALDTLKTTLRSSGYSEQATEEISAAVYTLANYGLLGLGGLGLGGLGVGFGGNGSGNGNMQNPPGNLSMANIMGIIGAGANQGAQGQTNMAEAGPGGGALPPSNNSTGDNNPSVFGPVGSTTTTMGGGEAGQGSYFAASADSNSYSPGAGNSMFDNKYGSGSSNSGGFGSGGSENGTYSGTNQNSFGLGTGMVFSAKLDKMDDSGSGGEEGGITKKEMEVGEHIVGAILGPGGKGIVELQRYTCANIQISKKGVYAPGTRNRVVTVTGTVQAVQRAQMLIQQRIAHEEAKRARQNNQQGASQSPRQ